MRGSRRGMFFPEPEAEKDGMGRKGSYYWESQLSEYWDGPPA